MKELLARDLRPSSCHCSIIHTHSPCTPKSSMLHSTCRKWKPEIWNLKSEVATLDSLFISYMMKQQETLFNTAAFLKSWMPRRSQKEPSEALARALEHEKWRAGHAFRRHAWRAPYFSSNPGPASSPGLFDLRSHEIRPLVVC